MHGEAQGQVETAKKRLAGHGGAVSLRDLRGENKLAEIHPCGGGVLLRGKGRVVLHRRTGRGRENAHLHRHCESTDAPGQGRALHDLDGGSHEAKSPQDG